MNRSGADVMKSENQSKFIQDRISQVEKHFGDLCTNFAAYSRKNASLRDKGDVVGRSILQYADNESLNHTTKAALTDFAEHFSGVQDFREMEVKRLESRVLEPLSTYGHQCKMAKERLRQAFIARDREMKTKKGKSTDWTDLHQASVDASRSSKVLEEEMDGFEKKKLQDIKHILLEFVNTELLFHAKALEMYTRCYQSLTTMSEEEDLEEFRNSLRPTTAQARFAMQKASGSRTSLNSTGQSFGTGEGSVVGKSTGGSGSGVTVVNRRPQSAPKPAIRSNHQNGDLNDTYNTVNTSMYSDVQDDDDEDDDDEDDDDEDDDDDDDDDESEDESEAPQSKTKYSMFQAR